MNTATPLEMPASAPENPVHAPGGNPLLAIALANAELFTDELDEPNAAVKVGARTEVLPVRSQKFRLCIEHLYFNAHRTVPKDAVRREALATIEALARFNGPRERVFVRIGERDGNVYLDLADPTGHVVKVTPGRWEVQTSSPVRFRRPRGMLPLPMPERGGDIEELMPFVNVGSREAFHLLVGWIVAGMRPGGPYGVLVLVGEQGSAKTTTARVTQMTYDDRAVLVRSLPHSERDLAVVAHNSWIVSFDNLSGLTAEQSDQICRLATGGAYAGRQLYTDADEKALPFNRPSMINGIHELAERGDLVERSIMLHVPRIDAAQRVDETTFYPRFRAAHPRILGALLDGVAAALANYQTTVLSNTPRMADFARWVTAAETGLHWVPGAFMRAYEAHQASARVDALERDILASVLVRWMASRGSQPWTGTAAELHDELCCSATDKELRSPGWPKAHNALGSQLRRIAPLLRTGGVDASLRRSAKARIITVTPVAPSQPTQPSFAAAPEVMIRMSASSDDRAVPTPGAPTTAPDVDGESCVPHEAMTSMTSMTYPVCGSQPRQDRKAA